MPSDIILPDPSYNDPAARRSGFPFMAPNALRRPSAAACLLLQLLQLGAAASLCAAEDARSCNNLPNNKYCTGCGPAPGGSSVPLDRRGWCVVQGSACVVPLTDGVINASFPVPLCSSLGGDQPRDDGCFMSWTGAAFAPELPLDQQTEVTTIYFRELTGDAPSLLNATETERCRDQTIQDVRLVGGASPYEGRVEVLMGGWWGTVCNSQWDYSDATAICTRIHGGSSSMGSVGVFPGGSGAILLSGIACTGFEPRLDNCNATRYPAATCTHAHDAGVVCEEALPPCDTLPGNKYCTGCSTEAMNAGIMSDSVCVADGGRECKREWEHIRNCTSTYYDYHGPRGDGCYQDWAIPPQDSQHPETPGPRYYFREISSTLLSYDLRGGCTDKITQVRLADGKTPYDGRVEVMMGSIPPYMLWWGTVCNSQWDDNDAKVVCRMLDMTGGTAIKQWAYGTGGNANGIFIDDVTCATGAEATLQECKLSSQPAAACTHAQDAGVVCKGDLKTAIPCENVTGNVYCVGCSLEEQTGSSVPTTLRPRSVCVARGGKTCMSGNEIIKRCTSYYDYHNLGGNGCYWDWTEPPPNQGHRYYFRDFTAEVPPSSATEDNRCKATAIEGVRLVAGPTELEGRLEIMIGGWWGTVCANQWDDMDAQVVCRMLGMTGGTATNQSAYGNSDTLYGMFLDDVNCSSGNLSSLAECDASRQTQCTHDNDAGVVCFMRDGGGSGGGNSSINDTNECDTKCGVHGDCTISIGSYSCTCHHGYELDADGVCKDKNECLSNCGANGNCTNTPGGYRCICHPGYDLDPDRICQPVPGYEVRVPPEGGTNTTGMQDYTFLCPGDLVVYGVSGRSGATINAFGPVTCSDGSVIGKVVGDANAAAGTPATHFAAAGFIGIEVLAKDTLSQATLLGTSGERFAYGSASGSDSMLALQCPGGLVAVGLYGQYRPASAGYAGLVNSMGLICGRPPPDIDECASDSTLCDGHGACVNTPGNWTCSCDKGWTFQRPDCVDVDECESGEAQCDPDAHCTNTLGAYNCTCNGGYTGNGWVCANIDECAAGTHDCSPLAACNNTAGGFTCQCRAGFAGNGTHCEDVDECSSAAPPCHENATCVNTAGGFSCTCKPGFTGDGVAGCADNDECVAGTSGGATLAPCANGGTCINTVGGFVCVCPPGHIGQGWTELCADVDECQEGPPCHADAACTNTPGSFQCRCKEGYAGDGVESCADVDECTSQSHNCSRGATCVNTPGGFTCSCLPGTEADGTGGCVDEDECAQATHNCSAMASCTNSPGGYSCQCLPGYYGDGLSCDKACSLTQGVFYRWGNLRNLTGNGAVVASPGACCDLCRRTAGCALFTFVEADGRCWLKGREGVVEVRVAGAVSGAVLVSPSNVSLLPLPVPKDGDPCSFVPGGAWDGTWDSVTGRCMSLACQGPALASVGTKECQEAQCRWIVAVPPDLQIWSAPPCSGGRPVAAVRFDCAHVLATGATWHNCTGDARRPVWSEVVLRDGDNARVWVPQYTATANGPQFHLENCTTTHCGAGNPCLQAGGNACDYHYVHMSWVRFSVSTHTKLSRWYSSLSNWKDNKHLSSGALTLGLLTTLHASSPPDYQNSALFRSAAGRHQFFHANTTAQLQQFIADRQPTTGGGAGGAEDPSPVINITVYFHVVQPKGGARPSVPNAQAGAFVHDDQITEQIRILNAAFNGSGVRFTLPKPLRGKASSKLIVDRVKLTAAKLYGAVLTGGGDGERMAAEKIWLPPPGAKSASGSPGGKPNATHLHVITTKMPEGRLAALAAFPWELRSVDASDMRRKLARHDMIVMDHDCMPFTQWDYRFKEPNHPCGINTDSPYAGYVLVHEVGHWLGLRDTFMTGSDLSTWRSPATRRISLCEPQDPDGVQDTPRQWCPTAGASCAAGSLPQCHKDAVAVYKGSYAASDPRCSSERDYPDPSNAMNYYWWVGTCNRVPTFTAGQMAFVRRAVGALRISHPYKFADEHPLLPVLGDACGDGIDAASVANASSYDITRGSCRTVTACARMSGLSLGSYQTASGQRDACDGPAGTVQCCFPAVCRSAPRSKPGFCVSGDSTECRDGKGLVVTAAARDVGAGGCPSGASCCVPTLMSKVPTSTGSSASRS